MRYANWEATLEPVYLNNTGEPFVTDEDVVLGLNGEPLPCPEPNPNPLFLPNRNHSVTDT